MNRAIHQRIRWKCTRFVCDCVFLLAVAAVIYVIVLSNQTILFICLTRFHSITFDREDPVLGQAVHKEISTTDTEIFKSNGLQSKLLKARSPKDSRKQVLLFSDLLSKCLSMDPNKRISCKEALRHDFFATDTTPYRE